MKIITLTFTLMIIMKSTAFCEKILPGSEKYQKILGEGKIINQVAPIGGNHSIYLHIIFDGQIYFCEGEHVGKKYFFNQICYDGKE